MKHSPFPASKSSFLRAKPNGFLLGGNCLQSLLVLIKDASLVRKRFKDNKLLCYAPDGEFAKNGSTCRDCTKAGCASRIRLCLAPLDPSLPSPLFIELSFTSAKNFLLFVRHLEKEGIPLYETHTQISLIPRGSWAEVIFSIPLQ